ncbi:hypothetical protein ACIQLG_19800 [Terribacillus saccharophilus]
MIKTVTITYNVVTQRIEVDNPDDLNQLEFLGLLETAKAVMNEQSEEK